MKFKSLKALLETLEKEKAIPLVVVGYTKSKKKKRDFDLMYFSNPGLNDVTEFDEELAEMLQGLAIKYTRRKQFN